MSGKWTMPFVMQGINTRVVRRSAALLDGAYGAGAPRACLLWPCMVCVVCSEVREPWLCALGVCRA